MISKIRWIAIAFVVGIPFNLQAANSLPASAPFPDTVYLKQSCGSLQNCADNMQEMLDWVWNIRQPSVVSPLLMEVGTGDFSDFSCINNAVDSSIMGHLTVRGAGRENTRIIRANDSNAAVDIKNCSNLSFQDLTVLSNGYGVQWINGGSSTWTNVRVSGSPFGWWDFGTSNTPQPVHYWFGSKIETTIPVGVSGSQGGAIFTYEGDHWFYGGEITLIKNADPSNGGSDEIAAVVTRLSGKIRIFGSLVRAIAGADAVLNNTLVGVDSGSVFHMHGGQITVDARNASTTDVNVWGVKAFLGGVAHTPGASYNIIPKGNGTLKRAKGGGVRDAFLWPSSDTPPNIVGTQGKDLFIENDCDDVTGNCDGGGNGTHLMISNFLKCGTDSPWFDIVTRQCRSANNP